MFDLRREDVYAADDEHIVASSLGLCHAYKRSAAGTFFVCEGGDVTCAVAYEREGFFADAGENKFADFAVGQYFPGFGIDYFRIEEIFVYVQSALAFAVEGDAGTRDLAESVYIICLDVKHTFYFFAHILRPRLRAEYTGSERQFFWVDSRFTERFTDIECV